MLVRVYSVKPSENHGLNVFKAGQRLNRWAHIISDGVANFCIRNILEIGDHKAHFAGHQFLDLHRLGSKHA